MIARNAQLTIRRIPIACLQVKEYQQRYPDTLLRYIQKMQERPQDDAGIIHVVPSDTHTGMFCVLDGHHKYVASIMTGREDALCLVVESPEGAVA